MTVLLGRITSCGFSSANAKKYVSFMQCCVVLQMEKFIRSLQQGMRSCD